MFIANPAFATRLMTGIIGRHLMPNLLTPQTRRKLNRAVGCCRFPLVDPTSDAKEKFKGLQLEFLRIKCDNLCTDLML